MPDFAFSQLDVFASAPLRGNPLAVVHDATGLDDATMARIANWTNLSETTFLLPPAAPRADYSLRIFTPARELPFAGHPTLGSCAAWLAAGGEPGGETVIQHCAAGLIPIRRDGTRLAFRAPPLVRSGPAGDEVRSVLPAALGLSDTDIEAVEWIDNGPGWCGVLLRDVATLKAIQPNYAGFAGHKFGLVAPAAAGAGYDFELRAFTGAYEDPVTGSLNASVAQWLIGAGIAPRDYIAAQGLELGRDGRVHITSDGPEVWVGGEVTPCIRGTLSL
ncbi:PhzF family phenazine biosynthesis protein [Pseudooceanicola sp. C21-150M6]|uniref:PhzF family phenazine biosynthesis protein n=1 Tax=Pseudooceanicola sp. C21-150M6 TaxID=3434355 RepID=UPI003D7F2164